MLFQLKRVYQPRTNGDGVRVLVDRLWPRGLKRSDAEIDYWAKDVAPSPDLRRWFNHEKPKWAEFRERYANELQTNRPAVDRLADHLNGKNATLLYAAKDADHNHAIVLRDFMNGL
jgi:uncharacterized protein YeaO (DUF488 family)